MQKFEFEKSREFGDVIGDSFQFIVKNFKQIILGFGLFVAPLMILGGLFMATMWSSVMKMMMDPLSANPEMDSSMVGGMFGFYVFFGLASTVLYAFVYGFIQKYMEMDTPPKAMDVWNLLPKYTARIFLFIVVLILIYTGPIVPIAILVGGLINGGGAVAGGLVALLIFLLVPLYIYVSVPITLAPFIYVHERTGIFEAIRRAFRLVKGKWWMSFAVLLVLVILASIVSYILAIPYYIIMFAGMLGSSLSDSGTAGSGTWTSISFMLMMLGSLLGSIYYIVGFVLHYFSLREQKEGTKLMERIESLGTDDLV